MVVGAKYESSQMAFCSLYVGILTSLLSCQELQAKTQL